MERIRSRRNRRRNTVPVREYLKLQGRFSHLKNPEIESIQKSVDEQWDRLQKKTRC